jgi:hypothetical protein
MYVHNPIRKIIPILLLLGVNWMFAAATTPTLAPITIELVPESSFFNLNVTGGTNNPRQSSISIRVTVTGTTVSSLHPVEIYSCIAGEEAMRLAGKASTLATANMRIRNDHGEWAALEPLAELGGRRGVRIAVVNGTSATVLLQVQMQAPASQRPGTYQGTLMLVAQEQ